jgi:hypothetical protein
MNHIYSMDNFLSILKYATNELMSHVDNDSLGEFFKQNKFNQLFTFLRTKMLNISFTVLKINDHAKTLFSKDNMNI